VPRHVRLACFLLVLAAATPLAAQESGETGTLSLEVDPREATVGDRISIILTLDLPPGGEPRLDAIGPQLGSFEVVDGGWSGPEETESGLRWVWRGQLAAYRTGELELPPITVRVRQGDAPAELSSPAVEISIRSLLEDEGAAETDPELADLKPPASIPGDYRALWGALALLALLVAGAALLWWLQRRYASRLAAARIPEDPFQRMPPHEWVYRELQRLLGRRLEEQGDSEQFFAELSRIVKQYLGGRYRIDVMERTTAELPGLLRQAGTPQEAISGVRKLLEECDLVKFARSRPLPETWRGSVEAAYRVVDATKPVDAGRGEAQQGAA
jgi:hypothetical protein